MSSNNKDDDIMAKINSAKSEYYDANKKNSFFKNQQKFHCANTIMSQLDETTVFSTIFALKENNIMFNYSLFKTIANPNLYEKMAEFIFSIARKVISEYGQYDLHFDAKGMTVSAIDRYKEFVSIVSKKGLQNGEGLLRNLNHIYIYNPPSFVDYGIRVLVPIVDPAIGSKISVVSA